MNSAERMFSATNGCLTFSFIDPFGYKGLSRGIVQRVVRDWGCDCVFFFNYARINAGLSNDAVRRHMDALFGAARVDKMRSAFENFATHERETFVLEELADLPVSQVHGTCFRSGFAARMAVAHRTH